MPITATDIQFRLTTKSGSAGDTTAGTPAGSLGGFTSTTVMSTGANGLFDDITGDENAASESEYRAIDVLNNHASLTLQNAVIYLSGQVAGGADASIGVDPTGPVAKGSSSQGLSIANEDTAPAGVSFSAPTTKAAGLALGNIGPGQVRRVWVRRTATNSAAINNDGVTFNVAGDTAA